MSGTKSGDVEYIIRADDSQIESDLEQANRKVEKAVKKSAEETVKIEEKKIADIKKENEKIVTHAEKSADKVEKAWGDVDIDADNSGATRAIEGLVDTSEEASKSIKEKLGEALGSIADGDFGKLLGNLGGTAKDVFTEAATSAVPFAGTIANITSGLSAGAVAAVGIGVAAVGAGAMAVNAADDMKGAMNAFLSETGKSREEAERYQNVLEDIYANNYGESFEDIAHSMATVNKTMGEMDDATLQAVTESAYALNDTFEYDIAESTRAAKALMDNFRISGEEAMSMIAAGAQNGLDYSGELLDSISEYSVQFDKMGLDADDMFKIFQKGAESGAFNLDKVGDAVKEMSIRVIDGSDTTKEGFELLGLDAEKMAEKFAKGGDTAKEAFNETLKALAAMEDPIAQNTAGVAIMGTMWEDLGPEAVSALADIEEGAYDTAEAMEQIKEVKYEDLGSMLDALKRNLELLLIPLGEALIPLMGILISSILPVVTDLLGPLIELFAGLLVPIISLISTGIEPLIDIMNFLITGAIEPLISIIGAVLIPVFSGGLNGMYTSASSVIGHIIAIFKSLIDFIRNVFTGNWSGAWQNIRDIFTNAVGGLAEIFKAPLNAVISGWNELASSLGGFTVPEWVPIAGGKTISLPKLPRLKVGMDYVPSDMFPAFLDQGEWVLTKDEASALRSLGGIESVMALKNLDSVREYVMGGDSNIDYDAMGEAVYGAFKRHGLGISISGREFGRIIEEIQEERG